MKQYVPPVLGVLQGPVRRQRSTAVRQIAVDDAVPVDVDRRGQLLTVANPHHHGAARQRAEVDADRVLLRFLGIRGGREGTG